MQHNQHMSKLCYSKGIIQYRNMQTKTPSALDVTLKQNPVYRLLTLSFTAISFNFFFRL